jgi:hypothetical protein
MTYRVGDMTKSDKAEVYRNRARDCLAFATTVADPLEWTELQHIASAYMRLAERAKSPDFQDQPTLLT